MAAATYELFPLWKASLDMVGGFGPKPQAGWLACINEKGAVTMTCNPKVRRAESIFLMNVHPPCKVVKLADIE